MTEILKKFQNWFSKFTKSQISYNKKGIRPARDWKIILGLSQIIVIIFALLALYFYVEVDKGKFFEISQNKSDNYIEINTNLLNKTVKDINDRQTISSQLNSGSQFPDDPSL